MTHEIGGEGIKIETLIKIAYNHEKVRLSKEAKKRVRDSQNILEKLIQSDEKIYGVTTGVGVWEKVSVKGQNEELQKRVILSHMTGTGELLTEDEVRAGMVLRANMIAKGYSAVRLIILETLVEMLNRNVVPVVYQRGSLGTSGDLVPLAHIAAVMMGEGEAFYEGKRMRGKKAMEKAGIPLQKFSLRDGLGLINGTSLSTGMGGLAIADGFRLFKNALLASAMTLDGLQSPHEPFDPKIHSLRPFQGQKTVADNIRKLRTPKSALRNQKTQDAFSLRCIPQVLGPSLDAFHYAKDQIEIEMNSASDNPLFFTPTKEESKTSVSLVRGRSPKYLSGGNFHGQSVAIAMDLFSIAMAEIGSLSERHTNRLLNPNLSGLPGFLVEKPGLNSGLMLLQYTAADLVTENRLLAQPVVIDNASVSADQEDHVSMASLSSQKARKIVENVKSLLAIELLCAAQALSLSSKAAYETIRKVIPKITNDRPLSPDIEKVWNLIEKNVIVEGVEKKIGSLKE
jgi:histidine ammonia-lyase